MLWAQQRLTITPEYVARRIERRYSPNGPSANALRYVTMSPEYTAMGRIELGVMSVVGQLRGGTHWGSIAAEHFEDAPPFTAMGKHEHAYFEERQLASHI